MRINKESIYTLKLVRRGVNLFGREVNVLRSLKVTDVTKQSIEFVNEIDSWPTIVDKIVKSERRYLYVRNASHKITGFISIQEIRQALVDSDQLKHVLIASDVANAHVTTVHEDDDLDYVMKRFEKTAMDELPVISVGNDTEDIIGTVWQSDVIAAYNREIFRQDMTGEMAQSLQTLSRDRTVHVIDSYHVSQIETPTTFIGKTLRKAAIHQKYNLEVLLIKRKQTQMNKSSETFIQPTANTRLQMADVLLVFGEDNNIKRFSKI